MDKKRTSKKKKVMGKLIQFPTNRIKRTNPIKEISEAQAKKIKENQFIEQLVETIKIEKIPFSYKHLNLPTKTPF